MIQFVFNFLGTIPWAVGQLTQLDTLLLSSNKLTGKTWHYFATMDGSMILLCVITGPIPTSIAAFLSLKTLTLDGNSLTGNLRIGILRNQIINFGRA